MRLHHTNATFKNSAMFLLQENATAAQHKCCLLQNGSIYTTNSWPCGQKYKKKNEDTNQSFAEAPSLVSLLRLHLINSHHIVRHNAKKMAGWWYVSIARNDIFTKQNYKKEHERVNADQSIVRKNGQKKKSNHTSQHIAISCPTKITVCGIYEYCFFSRFFVVTPYFSRCICAAAASFDIHNISSLVTMLHLVLFKGASLQYYAYRVVTSPGRTYVRMYVCSEYVCMHCWETVLQHQSTKSRGFLPCSFQCPRIVVSRNLAGIVRQGKGRNVLFRQ